MATVRWAITSGLMLTCHRRYGLPFRATGEVFRPIPGKDTVLSEGLYFLIHTLTAYILLCPSLSEGSSDPGFFLRWKWGSIKLQRLTAL